MNSCYGKWKSIRESLQYFFTVRWTLDCTPMFWHVWCLYYPITSKLELAINIWLTKTSSMYDNYAKVTAEEVCFCVSNLYYRHNGQDCNQKSLIELCTSWSAPDDGLRNPILVKTISVKPDQSGGPLFLIVMLKRLQLFHKLIPSRQLWRIFKISRYC